MSLTIWEWVAIFSVILINVYIYGSCFYTFMIKRGVKTIKPTAPFFGNFYDVLLQRNDLIQMIDKVYKTFSNERYVGFFEVLNEIILLRDPKIIQKVCIEASDNFVDHRSIVEKLDTALYCLKGQKWRDTRMMIEPAFNKYQMEGMSPLISECAIEFATYLNKQITTNKLYEVDVTDLFSRHLTDVIAFCVYRVRTNSKTCPESEIFIQGQTLSKKQFLQFANIMAYSDKLLNKLSFDRSVEASKYFNLLILDGIKKRKNNGGSVNDFIQYIVNMKTNCNEANINVNKPELTDETLISQALCFYKKGLSTLTNLLSLLFYEIAMNPSIQEKLVDEINKANIKNVFKNDYEKILSLEYLDMVVSETLRKWPPIIATDRECVKPYTLPPANSNAKTYTFLSKYGVWIPIYSIHHDPQHFPDPEIFDPERFSRENKSLIKPFTFIPFGLGPRSCIGSNFVDVIVKTTIFHILSRFIFVKSSKTVTTLRITNYGVNLIVKDNIWLGVKSR